MFTKSLAFIVSAFLAGVALAGDEPAAGPKADADKHVASAAVNTAGIGFSLRIDCGAEEDFKDTAGNTWNADSKFINGGWGFDSGDSIDRGAELKIGDTDKARIYQTEHYGMECYRITVPSTNARYKVTLHFAETFEGVGTAGDRVFTVSIEGKEVLKDLDIFKEVGANKALVKSFDVDVSDGELTIAFKPNKQLPLINGIEVTSAVPAGQ